MSYAWEGIIRNHSTSIKFLSVSLVQSVLMFGFI